LTKQVHLFGLTGAPVQENVVNEKGITTSRKNESGFMCQWNRIKCPTNPV